MVYYCLIFNNDDETIYSDETKLHLLLCFNNNKMNASNFVNGYENISVI